MDFRKAVALNQVSSTLRCLFLLSAKSLYIKRQIWKVCNLGCVLLSVYKESTQNSLSLNTVGTSNRRQFLCSENQICLKPAFCPKLELSLPLWIFSRTIHAAGSSSAGSGSFLTAFLLDSCHTHTYAPLWSSFIIICVCRISQRKLFDWYRPGFP